MPSGIEVHDWYTPAAAVVTVDGEIDAETCARVAATMARAVSQQAAVILDLTRVPVLSAAGLHCLDCIEQTEPRRHVSVHVVVPRGDEPRLVLETARLYQRWVLHATLLDALQTVGATAHDLPGDAGPRRQAPRPRRPLSALR